MSAAFVFVAALATAVATGLGALLFAFRRRDLARWLGPANAVASGRDARRQRGSSHEGVDRSIGRTAIGAAAGALFVLLAYRAVGDGDALHLGTLRGADARSASMLALQLFLAA